MYLKLRSVEPRGSVWKSPFLTPQKPTTIVRNGHRTHFRYVYTLNQRSIKLSEFGKVFRVEKV